MVKYQMESKIAVLERSGVLTAEDTELIAEARTLIGGDDPSSSSPPPTTPPPGTGPGGDVPPAGLPPGSGPHAQGPERSAGLPEEGSSLNVLMGQFIENGILPEGVVREKLHTVIGAPSNIILILKTVNAVLLLCTLT
jgi:hypothetical protein